MPTPLMDSEEATVLLGTEEEAVCRSHAETARTAGSVERPAEEDAPESAGHSFIDTRHDEDIAATFDIRNTP